MKKIAFILAILTFLFCSCSKTPAVPGTDIGTEDEPSTVSTEPTTESATEIETAEDVYTETESDSVKDTDLDTADENPPNNETSLSGKWESADRPPDVLEISEISEDVISIELSVFRYFTIHAEGNKNDTGFDFEDKEKGIKGTITTDGESIIVSVSDLGSFTGDGYLTVHLANLEFNRAE